MAYEYDCPNWMDRRRFHEHLSKPHWDAELGMFRCASETCNQPLKPDEIAWDHIIPKHTWDSWSAEQQESAGGRAWLNGPDNTQPMHAACNRQKSDLPDTAWSKVCFFDKGIDTTKLRSAQRDYVYQPIAHDYSHIFAKSASLFSGRLIWHVGDTGCGKTVSMAVAAFAINDARSLVTGLHNCGQRIRRILVVEKETPLRNQAAHELRTELTKFGITQEPPAVLVVSGSDDMRDLERVRRHDMCFINIQGLWRAGSVEPEFNAAISNFLRQFQAIFYDEPHYANEAISHLMNYNRNAWHLGFSASPFEADGHVRGHDPVSDQHLAVRLSVFGWAEANLRDGSVKGFGLGCVAGSPEQTSDVDLLAARQARKSVDEDSTPEARERRREARAQLSEMYSDIIEYVKTEVVQTEGIGTIQQTNTKEKAVADRVIEMLSNLDAIRKEGHSGEVSPHRDRSRRYIVGDGYFAHAIFRCDSIEAAQAAADYMNDKFADEPKRYPKKNGYRAICVNGKSPDDLADWLRYSNRGMRDSDMGPDCARIAVVVDLAREGTNNKACLIEAKCEFSKSLPTNMQGDGRSLRSTHTVDESGAMIVPPREFDNIKIVTHDALWAQTDRWIIPWGLHCKLHLNSATSEMPTLADIQGSYEDATESKMMSGIDRYLKVQIAERFGVLHLQSDSRGASDKQALQVVRKFWPDANSWQDVESMAAVETKAQLSAVCPSASSKDAAVCRWAKYCHEACLGDGKSKHYVRKQLKIQAAMPARSFVVRERVDFGHIAICDMRDYLATVVGREGVTICPDEAVRPMYETYRRRYFESEYHEKRSAGAIIADLAGEIEVNLKQVRCNGKLAIDSDFADLWIRRSIDEMLCIGANCVEAGLSSETRYTLASDQNIRDQLFGRVIFEAMNECRLIGVWFCIETTKGNQ